MVPLRRAGERQRGAILFPRKENSPPLYPQEKGTRGLPPRPRTLAVCGSKSCAACGLHSRWQLCCLTDVAYPLRVIRCGVHGFAMNPCESLPVATAPYYREARVTFARRQTACRMRHCCARRIQRNDRISGRFLVLLSRQVQLGQLRRRMPRMCSPCRGSRSRSLRSYHLENAPIYWSSAVRLEF